MFLNIQKFFGIPLIHYHNESCIFCKFEIFMDKSMSNDKKVLCNNILPRHLMMAISKNS